MEQQEVIKMANSISLLVIDEAHQAIAQTYGDAIDRLSINNRKMKIVGLTATPGRTTDGQASLDGEMAKFFSQNKIELVIDGYESPVDFLIEKGYLAKPIFENIDIDQHDSISTNKATIDLAQRALKEGHKRLIVFTESVDSAYTINAVLNAMGVECHTVDGSTPMDERNSIYQRYKKQSNRAVVLINYGVLTTGFDAPVTSAVIIARPVNSLIVYSQIIGRALRGPSAGGSANASIYNLYTRDELEFRNVAKAFQNWNSLWSSH
jgi:superfamily II DNA or RNA helicase